MSHGSRARIIVRTGRRLVLLLVQDAWGGYDISGRDELEPQVIHHLFREHQLRRLHRAHVPAALAHARVHMAADLRKRHRIEILERRALRQYLAQFHVFFSQPPFCWDCRTSQ